MSNNPPPIQEKPVSPLSGLFPQTWIRWFQDINDRLTTVENKIAGHVTWFDDNDTATTTTPISHTGGATTTFLTNNALGPFTNEYNVNSIPRIWDTTSNHFDFSSLKIGDTVFIRFDITVSNSANNQEANFFMDLGIGGSPYSLLMMHRSDKSNSGDKYMTFVYEIYIGDSNTLNYPAKPRYYSDDNADIVVNGWYSKVIIV